MGRVQHHTKVRVTSRGTIRAKSSCPLILFRSCSRTMRGILITEKRRKKEREKHTLSRLIYLTAISPLRPSACMYFSRTRGGDGGKC